MHYDRNITSVFALIVRPTYAQAKPKARFKHGTYGTQGRAIF